MASGSAVFAQEPDAEGKRQAARVLGAIGADDYALALDVLAHAPALIEERLLPARILGALLERVASAQRELHEEDATAWHAVLGVPLGTEEALALAEIAEGRAQAQARALFGSRVPTPDELVRAAQEAVMDTILTASVGCLEDLGPEGALKAICGEEWASLRARLQTGRGPIEDAFVAVDLTGILTPHCRPGLSRHNAALLTSRLRAAVEEALDAALDTTQGQTRFLLPDAA